MEGSFVEILFNLVSCANNKSFFLFSSPPETFRKSSLGHDETDKEKKKILGFFKVNKRSSSKVMDCNTRRILRFGKIVAWDVCIHPILLGIFLNTVRTVHFSG